MTWGRPMGGLTEMREGIEEDIEWVEKTVGGLLFKKKIKKHLHHKHHKRRK